MARQRTEAMDTSEIYRKAIEVAGAKRVAQALGLSLSHTYRLQRPTMDEDPDGTGARNDLDRVEALAHLLAAFPDGASVLVEMRLQFDALFDRVLGTRGAPALTPDRLALHAGHTLREFGEFVGELRWQGLDPDAVAKEGAEVIAAIEEIIRLAKEQTEAEPVRKIG